MQKKKIVITQDIGKHFIHMIQEIVPHWELIVGKEPDVWLHHLNDAEIIVGWKKEVEEHVLKGESKLRWLQVWSAGVNSYPLPLLEDKKVLLTSANGVHAYPISETIFALMLGLTRKINTYVKNQAEKVWNHGGLKLEMHEKTVGIIGVGAIGEETAKLAKAFRMHVVGVRHSGQPAPFVDEMFTPNDLNAILPKCDYVVITLPLTNETNRMFRTEQFKLMKPSSYLINIGRGEIVVEEELIKALQEGEIAGAGLDVFEKEPLSEESPLWNLDNVIVTPHTSGSTENYTKRLIEDIFIPNLKNYIASEPLSKNIVDYKKGY